MAAESILKDNKLLATDRHPLVSVIVPTYNRPEMLGDTVRSILNQTYPNIEIIVVNDAGADVEGVVNHLNRNGRISYARHARNRGLGAARNTGIRLAQGKYIAYLDDDDLFYPDHIRTLVDFLEGSEYKVAYTDAFRAHQVMDNGRYAVTGRDIPYSHDFDYDAILVNNFVPVLCFMHEKACIDSSGGFDETLTTHEDWELWIRMSRLYRFAHIAQATCEFSWRQDGSTMTSSKTEDFTRTARLIYEKHHLLSADKPSVLEWQRRALAARQPSGDEITRQDHVPRQADPVGTENDPTVNRLGLADNLATQGKFDEADQHYRFVLRADPENCPALIGIGVLKIVGGKHSEAAISFSKALRCEPDNVKAMCGLGMARSGQRRHAEAFDLYKKALASDPENLTVLNELIKTAYELDRLEEAEAYLTGYLVYHPVDSHILFSLAGLRYRLGNYVEALDSLEKVLLFDPDYEGGQELADLARIALSTGNPELLQAAGV